MKSLADPLVVEDTLRRLSTLPDDATPRWGRMTVQQMLAHLTGSFEIAMGVRPAKAVALGAVQRTVMRLGGLYLPMRWPKGLSTLPEVDPQAGLALTSSMEAERRLLISVTERFISGRPAFTFAPHALFGPMNQWQWMRWGYLHMDHHFRQFGV